MCGIAGIFDSRTGAGSALRDLARKMGDAILHRGPDGGAVWVDEDAGLALSHRRLAIVDLSEAGHQPMVSHCGNYVICYNGEVYNSHEIRPGLEQAGIVFKGHSDTEVILESCALYGIDATVKKLVGMFAFALWDRREKCLWLVRDRLGIKPLYWHQDQTGRLIFGSELKALRAHPDCPQDINRDAIASYMRHNYIPGPHSIYQGIGKLLPGQILRVSEDSREPKIDTYWSMDQVVANGRENKFEGGDEEALSRLENLLEEAIRTRMIADVPLGAFLSGGIDSSTVVALMQKISDKPVRSFSIGFNETGYNEAEHAKTIARHLGTDHTELYVSPEEAMAVIPKLPYFYDEPFSDSSQIPTYLVSAMTREHVTVALSGDGGDELFAGYNRYFQAMRIGGRLAAVPGPIKAMAGAGIKALPPRFWDQLFRLVPVERRPAQPGDKMHKLAAVLNTDQDGFYRRLISHWMEPEDVVFDAEEPKGIIWDVGLAGRIPDFTQRMQYLDTVTYLPDDILTKVDRASMAVSLEARVPILDHRIVEFAWTLPHHMKIRDGGGKWLLKQLLYKYVPKSLVERPKMGFGVPIDSWLRGPLAEWAEDLLSEETFNRHGFLRAEPVRTLWQEHKSGRRNWQYHLWDVLMLHAWADANR
ncbi:asparagine synthase (glutamine-hydrolyzing) [Aestuariispira insulae]|uniref:asparagine synthase (glutamine-hydrolyzing) n=1 Tax=Aestuariispira insulae TaxID=1461337 RepID=A0A3D9H483_9PROT|nr:asparagine synthase (glutamine-hydrolyzing) [Aestuariispira insulae]RED44279.1 asparagine synthase (glutamine-hydrolysing) [Aestuariispira insulae]